MPHGLNFVATVAPSAVDEQAGDKTDKKDEESEEATDEESTDEKSTDGEATEEGEGDEEVTEEGDEDKKEEAEEEDGDDDKKKEAEEGGDDKKEKAEEGDDDKKEKAEESGQKQAEEKNGTDDDGAKKDSSGKKDKKKKGTSSDKKADRQETSEPYLVQRKPLKIDVELSGTFVARKKVEIALRPKVWAQFKVVEAVRHGAKVRKGDLLVRFDDVKIEEALADKSLSQRLEEVDLMMAEEELPRLEKLAAIAYKNSQKACDELAAEYKRFKQTLRPLSEKIAKINCESAEESLAMEEEELEQLKQMYEADDLTEETEKIVLRRQRFTVKMARLYVEYARFNRDYTLKVSLPRREEQMAVALKQSRIELERAKMAKSLGLSKARYELEKKRARRARNVDQHARLLGDRALMVLKAPVDGMVYYGRCQDGKWSSITSLRAKLRPFGTVTPGTVLLTIVQPGTLSIVSTVSEKNFPQIHNGLKATIQPTGDTEREWEGKVAHVEKVPISRGKFPVRIDFDQASAPGWLVPDMTCKVKVTTYEKEDAILIPLKLVESDKKNEKRKYVLVLDEDEDEPVRRKVKLGHRKGSQVEIVKGLDGGEKLLKPAKDKEKKK